jgi:succinoglycan biosynthesis transport protein ExoP
MLELSDYLEILRRRKWVVLISLVVGLVAAGAVFMVMPKVYRSNTLVLIESQKVPADYIKPVVVNSIEERLITIQQQILSRTLLQKVIEEFELYKDELKRTSIEDIIELMRKDIKVTTVDDSAHRNIQAFTVSYDGENPLTVMQVTNKLASMFIEENLKVREQLVEGTSEFLENELAAVKEQLDQQEARISAYKKKNLGELPQQAEALMRQLDRLSIEFGTQSDALRMLTEKREILRDMPPPASGGMREPRRDTVLPPMARLHQLRGELAQLRSEYKDSYPDIIRVKREIKDLEEHLAKTGSEPAPSDMDEQMLAGIGGDAELRGVEAELKVRKQRRTELEEQIKMLEKRFEAIPMREQELFSLVRDYENTKLRYQTLLANKEQAKVSQNLEKRQKGEQFRILDPANLPTKPIKPNPLQVFLGGIVVGLMLGGGTIWWLDFRNLPFRRAEEVEATIGIPVFATIPRMFTVWGSSNGNGELPKDSSVETSQETGHLPWWKHWVVRPLRKAKPSVLYSNLPKRLTRRTSESSQRVFQAHMNALGAEQFRVLAGRIVQVREKKGVKVFAVTSSLAGEGKTTVALGLAMTLARDYIEDTVIIDGDIRNPEVSERLGLQDEKGMIDVLVGRCELDAALYRHTQPNLRILPAGTAEQASRGLTASRVGMQELLRRLKERDIFVILDAPPILPMADMNLYSEVVDSIIMIVRAEQTSQKSVAEALRFLSGGNIDGIVLNDVLTPRHQYYGRYTHAEQPPVLYSAGSKG